MKNIIIDANEANVARKVGTGEYTQSLLNYWHTHSHHHFSLLLKSTPLPTLPPAKPNWQYQVVKPAKAWSRFGLPLYLATHPKQDVFWGPAHYLPPYIGMPSIVTIHDLAYEYFPSFFLKSDLYKLRTWTKQAVKQATKVIAVSQATKQDLIKLYSVQASKIKVIYNGYNTAIFKPQTNSSSIKPLLSKFKLHSRNYILFLGTIQPRKNIIKLVQAFHLLKRQGYSGKLVIAGKPGWLADHTLTVIKQSPDTKDIILTGYVSDQASQILYNQADVYALPSLYEGFGVPVLEAMASGCPVVASNNSSLPEVVGQAGVLFNQANPSDIVKAISIVKQNRAKYIKLGFKQVQHFSWEKSAKQTLKLLTEV